ncbi:MAG: tetratricopeptide repeat protein [Roseiflexus sp.]|nr:tetratricopeptide repeat protein [Roseiflexus sp.]MBO9333899.1 tetratricopeptide repeat protein [Roseiflexus sp.]MBO9365217.1 tetratricopeptide repeat protein [Roseiflexus sp.]MBO9381437.1 tetratricopeptide repeat protein [Roseiflexus sp.]MBO9387697.1 tetratricopeptide repeat protein [Roseiflexus sp.]
MTDESTSAFHRRVAEELAARYSDDERAPEDWREIQTWHWEQAGVYAAAVETAMSVTETRIARLDFSGARRWTERVLALTERLDVAEQRSYELRACALALAVLEFGGQYREGLEYARRMLRAAQRLKNAEAEARALLGVGRMHRELGQLMQAEAALNLARDRAARDDLSDLEAEARLHLAKVHQLQGRHLEALQELQLAREEHETADDKLKLARVLTSIGDVYRVLGSSREAFTFYTRALSLEQGRGSLIGQAILKDKLALTLLDQNRAADALASAEESLELRRRINDIVGQARSYTVIGAVLSRLGRHERAMESYKRACELQELTQNPRGQCIALIHLGDAARALRQSQAAIAYYERALVLARRDRDWVGITRALERLGDLHAEREDRTQALARWSEALQIRETLRHVDEAAALRRRIRSLQKTA